jgi:hypothetical protein
MKLVYASLKVSDARGASAHKSRVIHEGSARMHCKKPSQHRPSTSTQFSIFNFEFLPDPGHPTPDPFQLYI